MTNRASTGLQTLVVGLDGACEHVLRPHLDAGRVPTLARVLSAGASAPLTSQIPPWTPSAWPSLYTGVNPGKHGVFDFLAFDGYDWNLVNFSHVREHALWELLDRHGHDSVVVNAPVTHPPRAFDGALVPGYIAPDEPTCHPEGLLDDLRDELGEYRVYAPEGATGAERVDWYERLVAMRGEAFRYLADRFDPDFGFLQFQQTDTVFHERPEDEAAVAAVFEAVDDQLARVLDECDPDTVVVASDHGIGPYAGPSFRVNDFLDRHDFVTATSGEGGMPSWDALARERRDGESPGLAERAVAAAARVGVTSQRVADVLDRVGLADAVAAALPADVVRAGTERVDFPESTVYMRSRTELGVRINRAGREPDGVVSPAEYPSVRADVVNALQAARTPDGTPVFSDVAPAEDYFTGPYIDEGPDVVTVPHRFDVYLSASLRGEQFGDPPEPWNHKLTGIFAVAGDGVDATADLGDPHLFDVAPTVLATMGVPPSTRMDGDPVAAVDGPDPREYAPFTAGPQEGTDDDGVKRRLSNLGYLDDDNR